MSWLEPEAVGSACPDLILFRVCWWRPCDVQVQTWAFRVQTDTCSLALHFTCSQPHGSKEVVEGPVPAACVNTMPSMTWSPAWVLGRTTPTDRAPGTVGVVGEGMAVRWVRCCMGLCIFWGCGTCMCPRMMLLH